MQAPGKLRELVPQDMDEDRACTIYDVLDVLLEECAGLSWPGVVLAEDRAALDYLASRPDVDADQIGCGGLSGQTAGLSI